MARLPKDAETSVSMGFLVMCAETIMRLIRLSLVFIFFWLYAWHGLGSMRMEFAMRAGLRHPNRWPQDSRDSENTRPLVPDFTLIDYRFEFRRPNLVGYFATQTLKLENAGRRPFMLYMSVATMVKPSYLNISADDAANAGRML